MIISLTPTNPIPTNGQLQISFNLPYWFNDISKQYFLNNSALSCTNGSTVI